MVIDAYCSQSFLSFLVLSLRVGGSQGCASPGSFVCSPCTSAKGLL